MVKQNCSPKMKISNNIGFVSSTKVFYFVRACIKDWDMDIPDPFVGRAHRMQIQYIKVVIRKKKKIMFLNFS